MSYIATTLDNLIHQTAFFNLTGGNIIMIAVACLFLYLAIAKGFEPLLLTPIAFGMLLVNIYPDIIAPIGADGTAGGLLYYFYLLDEWAILPSLIFMGVGALQLLRQQLGLGGVRIPGVQQHQKGLPRLLHVSHRPCLRLQIVVPRDIGDASIGGHHHANGTVILHDLPGSQLCCLGHGDLMVIPWRCHHSRLSVLLCAHGPGHHIAHRVNEAHPKPGFSVR